MQERAKRIKRLNDQVFDMVSQDLRGPLQSLISFVENGDDGTEESIQSKAVIQQNVQQIKRLMENLVYLEQLTSQDLFLNKSEFGIAAATVRAVELESSLARGKNVSVDIEGYGIVLADEHHIINVIARILGDAIKRAPINSTVLIKIVTDSANACVSITNEGSANAKNFFSDPLDPSNEEDGLFFQSYQGSQLDLAICREIIALHGGTISVLSRHGQEWIFSFKIPRFVPST